MKLDVEHVVFDLGGVLLNIDLERISVGFAKIMQYNQENVNEVKFVIVPAYETGKISTDEFLNHLSPFLKSGYDRENIVEIWNSIIQDLPKERLDLLLRLRKKFKVHLLSNINDLHASCFEAHFRNWFAEDPRNYFDRYFYSHEIHRRKPNVETFEWVVNELNCAPHQVLFIDDMLENVEGAAQTGIHAHQLINMDVIELVESLGLLE